MSPVSAEGEAADKVELARLVDECTDVAEAQQVMAGRLGLFGPADRVLDVGCGRGAFVRMLQDSGRRAVGIDSSSAAVRAACADGLEVLAGDAVAVLRRLNLQGERFDGVMLAHVIEHFAPAEAADLLAAIAAVLRAGGKLVVVTPNFHNLIVATELFWLDPTHVRPYPRPLIERLGQRAGMSVLHSGADPATRPRRTYWKRSLATLRSLLSGADRSSGLDSLVVLTKP